MICVVDTLLSVLNLDMSMYRPLLSRLLILLFAGGQFACGTTGEEVDAGVVGGTDAAAVDVPLAFEVTVTKFDPFACPSGHGCACAVDTDCTSGACIVGAAQKQCSVPCGFGCPTGLACGSVVRDGEVVQHCVPAHPRLCDPCTSNATCVSLGRPRAVCVSYGPNGNFCGTSCDGDADCPKGFACEVAQHAGGGVSLQCVMKPAGGAPAGTYGTCACSESAKNQKLSTTCYEDQVGARCYGSRACSKDGLGDCDAKTPAKETCDLVDNDCNGLVDEDTCSDGSPCTVDACEKGKCVFQPVESLCNADDSVCTSGDKCVDGKCVAGAAASCDDGNKCTKDSCDPVKGCASKSEPTLPCDADGNQCTVADACLEGVCTAGDAKDCDDKKPCTIDSCDPKTGKCANTLVIGLSCDDGDACTHTDLCSKDKGCAGTKRDCNDGNACTADTCPGGTTSSQGCTHAPKSGDCEDGNLCTTNDTCAAGACKSGTAKNCAPSKPCMTAFCAALTGKCVESQAKVGFGCDDNNPCTENDFCDAGGTCQGGAPKKCGDGSGCGSSTCNKSTGKCEAGQVKDGTDCDDGDPCTEKTKCAQGKCTGGAKKSCDDNKACTADSCEVGKGCIYKNLADGALCDDGNKCSLAKCTSGSCVKTKDICNCNADKDCDDENPCTNGKCDNTKCAYSDKKSGDKCDDLNACTSDDKCSSSGGKLVCAGAAKTDCDDKEACTIDSCDPLKGCQHKALADKLQCDDGSLCTKDTTCDKGTCQGTATVTCKGGAGCKPEQCDPKDGKCKQLNAKDGTKCDDNNKCTEDDACASGTCKGSPLAPKVVTLAGTGNAGYKDGKGSGASFFGPTGVAVDGAGNAYVAEGTKDGNYRIRKVTSDGTVTTWAGQGLGGASNGTGTEASFKAPRGLAVIGTDLYVADAGNALIRKIASDRKVTTLAGTTASKQHSDGLNPLYFGMSAGGFQDGKGTAAQFNVPYDVAAVGSGSAAYLVVADTDNHRIRKLMLDGTVSTLAGSGAKGAANAKGDKATFSHPVGVAVDGATIYVSDNTGHRIRRISADGTVTTLAGSGSGGFKDGTGTAAQFKKPLGLAVDVKKTLLVADWENYRVRALATSGAAVTTYAGSGTNGAVDGKLSEARFKGLWGIAADGKGNTYAVSPFGHALRVIQDPFKACVP